MITLEKFFQALEKVKAEGRSSLGLIISNPASIDYSALKKEKEKISIGENVEMDDIMKKINQAFQAGKWIILEAETSLPAELYSQLKLLSLQNRLQVSAEEIIRQPESTRIIVFVSKEIIKKIEKDYPDFRQFFGLIINL